MYYQVGIYAQADDEDASLPLEIILLEAANGDPLRAMEIEDRLPLRWWKWYVVNRNAMAKAQK